MEKTSFSIKEAFRFGWKKVNEHLGVFVFAVLILIGVNIATQSVSKTFEHTPYLNILVRLCVFVISLYVQIGLTKLFLRVFAHEQPKIKDVYYPLDYKTYKNYFLGTLICIGISVGPCIALGLFDYFLELENFSNGIITAWWILFGLSFIWCIFSSLRLQFFSFLIVDKKMDGILALRKSLKMTKGNMGKIFSFFLLMVLAICIGFIFVFVGLFIAIPIVMLATLFVYKQLLGDPYQEKEKIK